MHGLPLQFLSGFFIPRTRCRQAQRIGFPGGQAGTGAERYRATLTGRKLLNPDSDSPGLYLLRFSAHQARWQPGDSICVRPYNRPELAKREYSVASICGDRLELIVRQAGLCSDWLCETLELGEQMEFQVCSKPDFHAAEDVPAIFIGDGSGMAGLRGHLQARPRGSHNWLIVGEQCPQTDRILSAEVDDWLMSGQLQYMNYAFSSDPQRPVYIKTCLQKHQYRLREWLENGAVIYLCGSLQGLGRNVEVTLLDLLKPSGLKALKKQNRYRTDLF